MCLILCAGPWAALRCFCLVSFPSGKAQYMTSQTDLPIEVVGGPIMGSGLVCSVLHPHVNGLKGRGSLCKG